MNPGIYTFYNNATHRYLSCKDTKLVLDHAPKPWVLKPAGGDGYYVYTHNTQLLLDIDNAWMVEGNTVKVWKLTGYDVQIWKIAENLNGTFSILSNANNRYCLGFDGENAVLQLRRKNSPMQEWRMTDITATIPKEYLSIVSKGKTVELQLPPDITRVISVLRLQRWADQLEIAYNTFCELTDFRPYRNIAVEAYKPNPYPNCAGWVSRNSNEIHIDSKFIFDEMRKLHLRKGDWNFCALHEMGHMFDFDKPWNFEPELMTDLKVAYVMEKNNAGAAMAQFDTSTCFYGANISKAYELCAAPLSEKYDVFGCTKRFLDIKDQIGWEPFRQTFHYLQKNSVLFAGRSNSEKFGLFVGMLSRYSGREIKEYFTPREWNGILRYVDLKK